MPSHASPRGRHWTTTAGLAGFGASLVGVAQVVRLAAFGPVAPGLFATSVLLGMAIVVPGLPGAALGAALGRWVGERDLALGLAVGAAAVAGCDPLVAAVALIFAGVGAVAPSVRFAVVLFGLAGIVTAGVAGRRSGGDGPKVLLVTVAGARADLDRRDLPALDAISDAGVRFEHAYALSDQPSVARRAVLTGAAPWESARPTLAQALSEAGFATAAFVRSATVPADLEAGFDRFDDESGWLVGGSYVPLGRLLGLGRGNRGGDEAVDRVGWWLARQRGASFAWLDLSDAEGPWAPPPPFDERHVRTADPLEPALTSAEAARLGVSGTDPGVARGRYVGTVAAADHALAGLLADLDRDVIVVWVGVTGARLGEDGLWNQAGAGVVDWHVPLAVRAPGVAPRAVALPVETGDVAGTVLSLVGVDPGERGTLVDALRDGEVVRPGARSIGRIDGAWVASVGTRHGRATRGLRRGFEPAGEDDAPVGDAVKRLVEGRADALLAELE